MYGLLGPDKLITSIKGVVFLSVYEMLVGWLVLQDYIKTTQKSPQNINEGQGPTKNRLH